MLLQTRFCMADYYLYHFNNRAKTGYGEAPFHRPSLRSGVGWLQRTRCNLLETNTNKN